VAPLSPSAQATALIGLGLFSLLRTSPERTDSETWIDRYAEDPSPMIRCPRRIAHQRDCTQPCPIATIAITICSA
jgi:hypothetical protein